MQRAGDTKVTDDPEELKRTFGIGWYKYAPDVAAKLLEKNGFTRDREWASGDRLTLHHG